MTALHAAVLTLAGLFLILGVPYWLWPLIKTTYKTGVASVRYELDRTGLTRLPAPLALAGFTIWSILFFALLFGVLWVIIATVTRLTALAALDPGDLRWFLLTLTATTAALGAVVALPFTLLRTGYNARQTRTAEENLTTDLINQAVAGLGAQKEVNRLARTVTYSDGGKPKALFQWYDELHPLPEADTDENGQLIRTVESWQNVTQTIPNLEVRLGAIYALERIAQDSHRDRVRIMEILCAYIRLNAPATSAHISPLQAWPNYPENRTPEALDDYVNAFNKNRENLKSWIRGLKISAPTPADIQAAIEVIGRRSPAQIALEQKRPHRQSDEPYRLDLRGVNLQAADLSNLDLKRALLTDSHLEGADLTEAHLEGADLTSAHLEGADLTSAHLEGTGLRWTHLKGADLRWTHLKGADLRWAHLEGAGLDGAYLEGANLLRAHLEGADLRWAHLEGAGLNGAHFSDTTFFRPASIRGAGLKDVDMTVPDLDPDQLPQLLAEAFGDASVILPNGLTAGTAPLAHWSPEVLELIDFYATWITYKTKPANAPAKP
ncbi:pentapeptide repeat-containing protein [Rhodobacteraceae bacterium SC52]|nr:pentapeptide repeat-containing protein [Rhodobacteraceae bacterium SC52]